MYMGGKQAGDLGNKVFPAKHIAKHGELGALFMRKKADIKMGDTPSVLYVLDGDADDPESQHWGGVYVRPDRKVRPTYWHDNPDASPTTSGKKGARTVSRWREEYLRGWQARMDRAASKKPDGS